MIGVISVFLAIFSVKISAAYVPDEILSLPGWSGQLPSKQYSGYLNASENSRLHYWLVESESSPETAPTVIWFNGGPGCSSLDGFIYEHGPFVVSDDAQTLTLREYRWNRIVNMLYIEAPVGVGFSYSTSGSYDCDDDRTAAENLEAVNNFYDKFPELKDNGLYITGESYAGVYVPTLAEAIVKGKEAGTYRGASLKGMAAGNGCSGTEVGICGDGPQGTYYEWSYLLQTAFIDSDLKSKINEACDWDAAAKNVDGALSVKCAELLSSASSEIGNVNLYNIYGDCVSDNGICSRKGLQVDNYRGKIPLRNSYKTSTLVGEKARKLARIIPNGPNACIDSAVASDYLNQPAVMEAIHVKEPGYCWTVCGSAPGWKYTSTRKNLPEDTYPLLIANMEVVVFNGDWDACVPFTDGEGWTKSLGYSVAKNWHPWTYTSTAGNTNQVAGYAVAYDVTSLGSGSFQFVTVKGGRHEVPETAPAQALELLSRLVNNQPF